MILTELKMAEVFSKNAYNNFLAVAITPWHAHGIDVALMKLQDKGVNPKGIVFLCSFPDIVCDLTEDDFCYNSGNIQFISCKYVEYSWLIKLYFSGLGLFQLMLCKNQTETIYIINPIFPNLNWISLCHKYFPYKRVSYIIIDEGCGTYTNTNTKTWIIKNSKKDAKGIRRFLDICKLKLLCFFRDNIKKIGEKRLKTEKRLYSLCLYKKKIKSNKLFIDHDIKYYYIQVFNNLNKKNNMGHDFSGGVIISTAFLNNGEKITEKEEIIWKTVIGICNKHNLSVFVKPHPREKNIDKYKIFKEIQLITDKTSQERMMICNKLPKLIIGLNSTTLINLSAIWNIPAISLLHIYDNNGIDIRNQMNFDFFIKTFSSYVMFPKDIEELIIMLNGIMEVYNDER